MRIEEVFNISGRGIVAAGTVQDISLNINDHLNILDENGNVLEANVLVKGIE